MGSNAQLPKANLRESADARSLSLKLVNITKQILLGAKMFLYL